MITRDQAQLLLDIDATVSDLGHADRTWRENAAYYAVIPAGPTIRRDKASVVFVNKASGLVKHASYAAVEALLEVMRAVD